jgi:hypothetical protein
MEGKKKFVLNKEYLQETDAVTEVEELALSEDDLLMRLTESERECVYTFFKELVGFYL